MSSSRLGGDQNIVATNQVDPRAIRHDARRRRTHNVRSTTRLELARERRIAAQVEHPIIPSTSRVRQPPIVAGITCAERELHAPQFAGRRVVGGSGRAAITGRLRANGGPPAWAEQTGGSDQLVDRRRDV